MARTLRVHRNAVWTVQSLASRRNRDVQTVTSPYYPREWYTRGEFTGRWFLSVQDSDGSVQRVEIAEGDTAFWTFIRTVRPYLARDPRKWAVSNG